jgi:hypothetical protein
VPLRIPGLVRADKPRNGKRPRPKTWPLSFRRGNDYFLSSGLSSGFAASPPPEPGVLPPAHAK